MSLLHRFNHLDTLLCQTSSYWQLIAFEARTLPWDGALNEWLMALSDEQVTYLDNHPQQLHQALRSFIPQLAELEPLLQLPHEKRERHPLPFWLSNGIKGRKLLQLQDFVSHIDERQYPILEWCAGKGHLGRMLAYDGAPHVHSIELQASLCEQGQHSAHQQNLSMSFSCADVLRDDTFEFFKEQQHAVALHACGRLHQVFMQQAVKAGCEKISLSPCCYHLFTDNMYQAMSDAGQQSNLRLTHSDMKLALQETVTAPERIAKVRKKEVTWRLGFDALRRDITGVSHYVSVPSVNKAIFSGEFSHFCLWAAEQKGITLPQQCDYEAYLVQGQQRKKMTDRIELVRHAFRRAIEIWLVLDRALYLHASGYDVSLYEFCDKQLTPRNILIQAMAKIEERTCAR
ncbi:methyltransferase [Pseudoalteromonas byunsanensis]|uniref:Methyltransferase n=1 Tax=Pseudoalteromonas byunsanensis TaxID=327939 RepID=A0A1S1NAH5_9GAMM|nr:methyltransferase [Pseudoalteromonas byunsanensis]OHU96366.1 methyltransferase [Pseudoalteromonas byunsanensis]